MVTQALITLLAAAEANDLSTVQHLLTQPDITRDQIDAVDPSTGRTPLHIASVNGYLPIAKALIEAGADQCILDRQGWTAREHAVWEGHLWLAWLFADGVKVPSEPLQGANGRAAVDGEQKVTYQRGGAGSQVFVYMGPSYTGTEREAVELDNGDGAGDDMIVRMRDQAEGQKTFHEMNLPVAPDAVNEPVVIPVDDPAKTTLVFEVLSHSSGRHVGIATARLQHLREGHAEKHESVVRHHTIPLIDYRSDNETPLCVGYLTFSILTITPFVSEYAPPPPSPGFWTCPSSTPSNHSPYPIIGHRGSGANSNSRSLLQLGENTLQSFRSAIDNGSSGLEFDVQLTKDLQPIIYHDFLVKETGGDIPVQDLMLSQFEHLSRSATPNGDILSRSEQRYLDLQLPSPTSTSPRHKSRRNTQNAYDNTLTDSLLSRVALTDEGKSAHGNKGNIRSLSIASPSTTLSAVLTSLPKHIAFDLEIKYPMQWECVARSLPFSILSLNLYVDTILSTLFQHTSTHPRNITISSFSPEVCIALVCKQSTFPVAFISKSGVVPATDIRAASLRGAVEFAEAWGLQGVAVLSHAIVMCPRLVGLAKERGLKVASWGPWNNEVEKVEVCLLLLVINEGRKALISADSCASDPDGGGIGCCDYGSGGVDFEGGERDGQVKFWIASKLYGGKDAWE